MPALSVSVDGQTLATVSSEDGYDMLNICIHGSRIDEAFAMLDFSGGTYPEEGDSTYLTWVHRLPLRPGQTITVTMQDQGVTSAAGKTIDELFPEEIGKSFDPADHPPLAEIVAELKQRPNLRGQYTLQLAAPDAPLLIGQTLPDEASLTFSVLWHALHRDGAARVSLHSGTLDRPLDRSPFNYHARRNLLAGESVTLQLNTLALP